MDATKLQLEHNYSHPYRQEAGRQATAHAHQHENIYQMYHNILLSRTVYKNICILSVWQVQVHTMLESDILSDCLARQHLHSSASSHQGNSSPLPGLDDFTGMHRWYSSKSSATPLWKWVKTKKGLIAQTPGLLSGLFHILPWPHLLLFLSLLSHSFDDSSSCQCLPCPITGHWLWASWPSPCPSFSFSKPVFQPNSFSFPFNGWTGIKKLSGTLKLSWQKREESVQESCPCLLLQTTCSFTRKTLRKKPQTAH